MPYLGNLREITNDELHEVRSNLVTIALLRRARGDLTLLKRFDRSYFLTEWTSADEKQPLI